MLVVFFATLSLVRVVDDDNYFIAVLISAFSSQMFCIWDYGVWRNNFYEVICASTCLFFGTTMFSGAKILMCAI